MSYRTSGQKELRRVRGQRASSIAGLLCENAANFQQLIEIIRVGSFFFQQKRCREPFLDKVQHKKVSGIFPGQSEGHLVAFATWDGGRKAGKHLNVSRTGICAGRCGGWVMSMHPVLLRCEKATRLSCPIHPMVCYNLDLDEWVQEANRQVAGSCGHNGSLGRSVPCSAVGLTAGQSQASRSCESVCFSWSVGQVVEGPSFFRQFTDRRRLEKLLHSQRVPAF